jgi:hypothetical protein
MRTCVRMLRIFRALPAARRSGGGHHLPEASPKCSTVVAKFRPAIRPAVDYSRAVLGERVIETDDVVVLLLGAPGGEEPPGHLDGVTRLEKLVFLVERETPVRSWVTEMADFRSHKFGPFSAKIYKAAEALAAYGLLEDSARESDSEEDRWEAVNVLGAELEDPYTTRTFQLTERGMRYYAALIELLPPDAEEVLRKFKERFATLSLRQLVRYVYERYPDFTDKSEIRDQILK